MNWDEIPENTRQPDFSNLLAVLQRKTPTRPTLFEFFLNERLYQRLAPDPMQVPSGDLQIIQRNIAVYTRLGYDYTTVLVPGFNLYIGMNERAREKTISQNEGGVIHNRHDLDTYAWPDPDQVDYQILDRLASALPQGMKIIVWGPGGVLENAIDLVGYEALCLMILDEPKLAMALFGAIGERLERYYSHAARYDTVGALISNDDWGFKTQTLFSPGDMRRFVFPWHKRIVSAMHVSGKPAILHSCGHFQRVIEDVIEDMAYDGRHSYEDAIMPVEEAYEAYHARLAILGGIDLDFVCRSSPQAVYQRSKAMLERSAKRGGFALGTGNSVPDYVPDQNYFALVRAALEN
jgi:uroporphyrinogen decarboxylase